jgi:hypothetical protein
LVTILFVIRGMESSPNFLQFDKDGTKGLLWNIMLPLKFFQSIVNSHDSKIKAYMKFYLVKYHSPTTVYFLHLDSS